MFHGEGAKYIKAVFPSLGQTRGEQLVSISPGNTDGNWQQLYELRSCITMMVANQELPHK